MPPGWPAPYWQLWYLLCLFFWRLIMPFWWRLRFPLVSAWILCALAVTFKINPTYRGKDLRPDHWELDTNLIWAWLPIFCLGATAKERAWRLWDSAWSRPAGLAVVLVCMVFPELDTGDAYSPAGELWHYEGRLDKLNSITGDDFRGRFLKFLIRLATPIVQSCCIWGFLHVMPRDETKIITSGGARSLAVYILHPLSGMLLSYMGCYGPNVASWELQGAPIWAEPVIFIVTILTSLFLMSPWVSRILWPMLDPPIHWFLKPSQAPADNSKIVENTRQADSEPDSDESSDEASTASSSSGPS
mmetsp:Transcript_57006/g.128619  ORF Transcript_57006/g.128619 Transcript_57006/m.128619 type:complete len:302 (+) Transcript_57006:43-948(+)